MAIIDELIALLGFETTGQENLKAFKADLDGAYNGAKKLAGAIGKFSAVAGAAVATGFGLLGRSVLDTNAKFESYLATLETIEGSADKAKGSFDWILDFAKTTPYEVDELTQAFIKLRSYGLDPMDGSMTTMGNTASAMGKSLDQVVEAVADAATGEFERLKELGMRAKQAGDEVTFAWSENGKAMSKTVKKNSAEITKFLYEVWDKRFGGAMEKQSKTWNGMMSNIGDTWTAFLRSIGDKGFFEAVKQQLQGVMDVLDQWDKDGTIDKIATSLSSAFTTIANFLGVVVGRITQHIKFLNENWASLEGWLKTVGIALGLLAARAFPIITVFGLLALAVDDFLTYMEGGESVIGNFIEWLRSFLPFSKEIQDQILKLGAVLSAGLLAAFAILPRIMFYAVGRFIIGPLLLALFTGITGGFAALGTVFTAAIGAWSTVIVPAITALSSAIGTGFAAAFAFLATPAGWAVILAAVVAALVAYFWDDLVSLWNGLDFASLGKRLIDGIAAGIRGAGDAIVSAIKSLIPESLQVPVGVQMQTYNANVTGANAGAAIGAYGGNAIKNMERAGGANAAGVVQNDNSTKTQNTSVSTSVTVNVKEATDAPAAVGNAVGNAANRAAQPSRMQSGSAMQ